MTSRPNLLVSPQALLGEAVEVEGDHYRHLFRARRLAVGEAVRVTDGCGAARFGRVAKVDRDRGWIDLGAPAPGNEPATRLELAVATLRLERASWLVEKATELGVTEIHWFNATRAPRRYEEAQLARLRRVAAAALEQCGGSLLPAIEVLPAWDDLLTCVGALHSLVLEPSAPQRLAPAQTPERRLAVIGPEGGLTARESQALVAAGGELRGLGSRTLRAETAAIAASAVLLADDPGREEMS